MGLQRSEFPSQIQLTSEGINTKKVSERLQGLETTKLLPKLMKKIQN